LVFVVLFIVETRGRTVEETAALFDGADKTDSLAQMSREGAVIAIRRLSMSDDDDDDDFFYPGKIRELESYQLRRPQLILARDQLGHTRGGDEMFSFQGRI
jgi:hypothetical protein